MTHKKIACYFGVILMLMGVFALPISATEPDQSPIDYDITLEIYDQNDDVVIELYDYRVYENEAIPRLIVTYYPTEGIVKFVVAPLWLENGVDQMIVADVYFDKPNIGGDFVGLSERQYGYEQNVLNTYDPSVGSDDGLILYSQELYPYDGSGDVYLSYYILRMTPLGDNVHDSQNGLNNSNGISGELQDYLDAINDYDVDVEIDLEQIVDVVIVAFDMMREITYIPVVTTIMTLTVTIGVFGFVLFGKDG